MAEMDVKELRDYATTTLPQGHAYSLMDALLVHGAICDGIAAVGEEPATVVEFAGGTGGTTFIIGSAIRAMGHPTTFYTCEGMESRWDAVRCSLEVTAAPHCQSELWNGDIKKWTDQIAGLDICALLIDAEHYVRDAVHWYIKHLWSRVISGGFVFVHDMFEGTPGPEREIVLDSYGPCGFELVHNAEEMTLPESLTAYAGPPLMPRHAGIVLRKI